MSNQAPLLRIGTSGWQYDHWRDVFYPPNLAKKDWFDHYTKHFDTVEINNSFYHLPRTETFRNWHDRAPRGFRYVLKFSRYGSHIKRLKDAKAAIATFLDRAEELKGYLGPILVQLPPRWHVDARRLEAFLQAAPRRHRWALEFRDRSWLCDEVFALLREHNAALCVHDMLADHPRTITADWVYLRFHGPGGDVSRDYSPQQLTATAQQIHDFTGQGLDVYAFFNNDIHGYAIQNATALKRHLS